MKLRREMNLGAYQCICKNCGWEFEIYRPSDFAYGERMLLTEDGLDDAYLNCFNDEVFTEVSEMVDRFHNEKNWKTSYKRTDCFNKVFGIACDPIHGKNLNAFRSKRACKNCGSDDLSIHEYNPPKPVKVTVNVVTHDAWNQKSKAEKEAEIYHALEVNRCL